MRPFVLRTHRLAIAAVLALVVTLLTAPASEADPYPDRPDFRLPFDCGASVVLKTYYGHNPDDAKIDAYVNGQPTGAAIRASAGGIVHQTFYPGGVEIRHGDGWFTTYMHMSWHVPAGTVVEAGDVIGEMGNVASPNYHLHYEQLYAPGRMDADNQHIVRPLIQGRGPIAMHPSNPITMTSTNCGGAPSDPSPPDTVDVDTFASAPGYDTPGGTRTGSLDAGTSYVYCKQWGPRVGTDAEHNHWWLRTDLDTGPAGQWVSAYYLSRWGNDEARDNTGATIRSCDPLQPYGQIGTKWWAMGRADSVVGAPTLPERDSKDGGRFQQFDEGMIIWHARTGAKAVHGQILDRYRATGSEQAWGFPTMDERPAAESPTGTTGRYQYFERALLLWSPQTGAHVVHGAILDHFEDNGREAALGYPVGEEVAEGDGFRQEFETVTLHWSPDGGVTSTPR